MQAIETRHFAQTNHLPSRIRAKCQAGNLIVSKDSLETELEENGEPIRFDSVHLLAAKKLAERLDWLDGFEMVSGSICNGDYVHVFRKIEK